jgi:hypothetical protein
VTTRAAALALFAAAIGVACFVLLPVDSDGAFAIFDGVLYGIQMERTPVESISGHHPLFHVLGGALTAVLRTCGVPAPGHHAARVLSAGGAALTALLVALAAGRKRWWVGAAFGGVLVLTRSFLIDAAVGESLLPACAAALWAVHEAARRPVRFGRAAAALVLAVLIREDNVLIAPGIAAALALEAPPGRRVRRAAGFLALTGAVTLAIYVACWLVAARGRESFFFWLTSLASGPGWAGHYPFAAGPFPTHLDALAASITGRTWGFGNVNVWLGPAFLAALLAAAWLLRGANPWRVHAVAIVPIFVARTAFFMWYASDSPKWSVLTWCLAAQLCAAISGGEARRPAAARFAGGALLAALAAWLLWWHGPLTLRLRETRFIDSVRSAVAACPGCRFIAHGYQVSLALEYLDVPHVRVDTHADAARSQEELIAAARSQPTPAMVVLDRHIGIGEPWSMAGQERAHYPFIDDRESAPPLHLLKSGGRTYAVHYTPAAESR